MIVINRELRDALGAGRGRSISKDTEGRGGLETRRSREIQPHSPWTSWDGMGTQEDTIFVFLQLVSH